LRAGVVAPLSRERERRARHEAATCAHPRAASAVVIGAPTSACDGALPLIT